MELTLDQALQRGVEAQKAGKVQEADRYYTAILKSNPKNPDANHNMGVLALGIGKVEQALPFFKTALEVKPSTAQFWLSYIDALIKLDRLTDAKVIFYQAKENGAKGDKFDKLEQRIRTLSKMGRSQDPPKEQVQPLIDLFTQGKLKETLESVSLLLEDFPRSVSLYNLIGVANKSLGRLEESIEAYNKALSIQPDYVEAYYNKGNVFQKQGKLEEAIAAYNKAILINPRYHEAYSNMGNALQEQSKLDEAIKAYNKALSIQPDYAEAYNNMGGVFQKQGKLEEAIEVYNKALSIQPDYAHAKHMLAALTGNKNKTAPREYVENLFDGYSKKFEASLVEKLEYKVPKLIRDILIKPNSNGSLGSVLDLGCGSGLLGPEIRDRCFQLEGIDLSSKMLDLAKYKNVYDKLSQLDIVEYLSSMPLDFDYYIALDVFIYVGELTEIFRLIKSRNTKPGHLVFSTEHTEVDGYHILKTGRYSHSKSYIESLCKKFGYNISHFSTTKLRKEKSSFLTGGIYLLSFKPE